MARVEGEVRRSKMSARETDGIDAVLFGEGRAELLDFKCFRGDRVDITEDDIRKEIHSAFMQRKMSRAVCSAEPPKANVAAQNVRDFVKSLEAPG